MHCISSLELIACAQTIDFLLWDMLWFPLTYDEDNGPANPEGVDRVNKKYICRLDLTLGFIYFIFFEFSSIIYWKTLNGPIWSR